MRKPSRQRSTVLGVEDLEVRNLLSTSPVTILPIGDSISAGLAPSDANRIGVPERASYRPLLWDTIQTEFTPPLDVEFVGTTAYNPTDLPAAGSRHAAYRGFWTLSFFPHPHPNVGSEPDGEINNNFADANGWGSLNPDIAIIQVGTNDIFGGRAVTSMLSDLRRIVNELRDERPDIQILVGTLPPMDPERTGAGQIPAANEAIRDLVNVDEDWTGSTEESPIFIVDHVTGVGDNPPFELDLHIGDGIHPNAEGDALLAANWWEALAPLLNSQAGPLVTFAETSFTVEEVADTQVVLTVTRSGDLTESLTVPYTVSGDATSGVDFVSLPGDVTFAAGSSEASITISVLGDEVSDPSESIHIQLQVGDGYRTNSASSAAVTVLEVLPTVSIAQYGFDMVESGRGIARFMVTRDGDSSEPMTIFFDLMGTATAGEDYVMPEDHVVIPAGQTSAFLEIALLDDTLFEEAETIVPVLREDASFHLLQQSASVTIADDDDRANAFMTIFANFIFVGGPFRLN